MINSKVISSFPVLILVMALFSCSTATVETARNFEIVELPDGSVAYLNHNSAVGYDRNFDPRSVQLEGEVFFSVAEGSTPFVVHTDLGEVTVTGTEFNVKAEDEEIEVEVEEGSVELKTQQHAEKVRGGEVAVFKKGGNEINIGRAEFKFRIWMKELRVEFKKLGREIKRNAKEIGKESREAGKELKKEMKKLKE
ncbi:MAG: FecR family protein [Cyclobacteriaceae bacterium]|nr:FecR family protein [Cyclobacteriaceae bacterium]MDH4295828.1 FecR family protein [Cyclobacteriaceae bacterium]MDH5247673.1 FecR family protein [Cyclobacteriaceae bacterium]